MKYYSRAIHQFSLYEYTKEGVKITLDWSNFPSDAVFNLHLYELEDSKFSRPCKIGDLIKAKGFPWDVRIISPLNVDLTYQAVRADAFPLIWIWRAFQWQIENRLKRWILFQFKKIGKLDCKPGEIPSFRNIKLF